MNILFIYENAINPLTGGAERTTFLLANYLENKGYNIFFLSLNNHFEINDKRQTLLPDSKYPISKKNITFYLNYLCNNSIDIVINKSGTNNNISKMSLHCKSIGIKIITVVHNSPLGSVKYYSSSNKNKFTKLHLSFLLPITDISFVKRFLLMLYKKKYSKHYNNICNNSDIVVLESDKFIEEIHYLITNKSLNNLIGISNFVILDYSKRKQKNKEILYVGRINTSQKRVDLLLNIWSLVFNRFPDWTLKIVGGGEELDFIKNLSSKLKLKNILFLGYQDAKPFYESASVICLTSSYEGFGISLIEAMSYGAVPIAFNSYNSVTDIINNNNNGFLISPFDIVEYANKLSTLMASSDIINKFSIEAEKSVKKFDLEIIGQKWIGIINKLYSS